MSAIYILFNFYTYLEFTISCIIILFVCQLYLLYKKLTINFTYVLNIKIYFMKLSMLTFLQRFFKFYCIFFVYFV